MGRSEDRITAEHEAVAELAGQLRQLRARAGSPTYRSMAVRTHYAATTLSRAAAGNRLPSLDVVLAYAAACGGDRVEWQSRWEDACAALAAEPPGNPGTGRPAMAGSLPRDAEKGRIPGRRYVWAGPQAVALLAIAGLVTAGLVIAGLVIWAVAPANRHQPRDLARTERVPSASDGDNPQVDACAAPGTAQAAALGAREVASRVIRSSDGSVISYLGLWRNTRCGAEWAEASYLNPHLYPVTLEAHRPADGATVIDQAIVNLPRNPVIGPLLRTDIGCVWAEMTLHIPRSQPITVRTPCS